MEISLEVPPKTYIETDNHTDQRETCGSSAEGVARLPSGCVTGTDARAFRSPVGSVLRLQGW
jgi:hypothetical protein